MRLRRRLYFDMRKLKMITQVEGPVLNRLRRGNMDELIGQPAVKAGIDRSVAEKTRGIIADLIIPGFLRAEKRPAEVCTSADRPPGSAAAIAASHGGDPTRFGMFGPGMMEIHTLAHELLRFGGDKTGADQMGEIIAGTPGLSRFA